jgi:hypothetical protein
MDEKVILDDEKSMKKVPRVKFMIHGYWISANRTLKNRTNKVTLYI